MAKKHDENKDLKSFSRVGKINYYDKTLKASRSAIIGIHMWGKVDFLTRYCGWTFIWDNSAGIGGYYDDDVITKPVKKVIKPRKTPKEDSFTDKTKKSNKHK